jgi:MFS family permease
MTSLVKQSSLFPLLLVNFLGTLGFSIVLPFLVFVVMKFGGNAIVYGLLAATYPAFQLIGAPILGRLSDIYGRKKVQVGASIEYKGLSKEWSYFAYQCSGGGVVIDACDPIILSYEIFPQITL